MRARPRTFPSRLHCQRETCCRSVSSPRLRYSRYKSRTLVTTSWLSMRRSPLEAPAAGSRWRPQGSRACRTTAQLCRSHSRARLHSLAPEAACPTCCSSIPTTRSLHIRIRSTSRALARDLDSCRFLHHYRPSTLANFRSDNLSHS